MNLAIYARQSKSDPGDVPSTDWQTSDAEKWAAAHGHEITHRFADIDTSGYRKVERPEFDRLLTVVAAGEVDGTLVWKIDRLSRQGQWGKDVLRFMHARAENDTALFSVHEGDTSTAQGEFMLGWLLTQARSVSEGISIQWRAQKLRAANAGLPVSGGHRWFGWTSDFELDPAEAEAIQVAASHVLGGGSLRSIVLAWNEAGLTTSTGRAWTAASLRQMLRSSRLAAIREHHGERVGAGTWPAILDEVTATRLVRLLDGRRKPGRPAATLLGGLLRCGKCGSSMRAGTQTNTGRRRYACPPSPDGCNGISIVQAPADLEVEARLLARLRTLKVSRRDTVDTEVRRVESELATLDAQLAEAATDYYGDRRISRGQFDAVSDLLGRRADKLRSELGRLERRRVSRDAASILATWDDRTIADRRTVIEMYVDSIKIEPATKGRVFDPARVKIRWAPS